MVNFIFCVHNHQPVGNFDFVLEDAYANSYLPFLETVSQYPEIKLTYHITGFLLDWIEEKHPEFITMLANMVSRGQVEMLGGGYYEPILCVIPAQDRLGQLRMMSERLKALFGSRPRGVWLAERVWEPTLPSTLFDAGVEYVVIDDYHFIQSGLEGTDLDGYYISEDQGKIVRVFPGSEDMRYLIPFKSQHDIRAYFEDKARAGSGSMALYADDGEKFGLWPGTKELVFDRGWLRDFSENITSLKDSVSPMTLSEYMDNFPSRGLLYLPSTSYMEMGHWALPHKASREFDSLMEEVEKMDMAGSLKRFLHGGNWRNFLSKYPESNWMHKRMLMVSRQFALRAGALDERSKDLISKYLYKAQSNDPFWHGIFGGLYMPHLRGAFYENLLRAQALMEQAGEALRINLVDISADGLDDVVLSGSEVALFWTPAHGGALVEIDYKSACVNIANTMTRWPEGYHHKLATATFAGAETVASIHDKIMTKEEGLETRLKVDAVRRSSFVDRFLDPNATLSDLYNGAYLDAGGFASGRYRAEQAGDNVELSRSALFASGELSVKKAITIQKGASFKVAYEVAMVGVGLGAEKEDGAPERFAVEINIMLPGSAGPLSSYDFYSSGVKLNVAEAEKTFLTSGEVAGVDKVSLTDGFSGIRVSIESSEPATLWRYPVETISLSDGGFERVFQGSALIFVYPLGVSSGDAVFRPSFMVSVDNVQSRGRKV